MAKIGKTEKRYNSVIITGANSGIGNEFSKLLVSQTENLILVGRDEKTLKTLEKQMSQVACAKIAIIALDLAQADAANTLVKSIHNLGINNVDLLVNNAGIGLYGNFLDTDWKQENEMIHLNVITLTQLTKVFANLMIKRNGGSIINVASTASFLPGPRMPVYYASKAFVFSFSLSIALELRKKGVTVTVLCPGATKTNFHKRAQMPLPQANKYRGMLDAHTVAKCALEGSQKNKILVVPGFYNQIKIKLVGVIPQTLLLKLIEFVWSRRSKTEKK